MYCPRTECLMRKRYGGDAQQKLHFTHVLPSGKTCSGRSNVTSFKHFPPPPAPLDKPRNKFAVGKLGQAAKSLSSFMHNKCSLHKHTSLSPSTGKASYGSKMPVVSAVSVFAVTVKSQFCSCFLIENRIFLYPKWRTAAGNGYEVWKITGSFFSPRLFPTMCC